MSVKLTSEAEKERVKGITKPTWGIFSDTSLPLVLHKARDLGWFEGKVQVRAEKTATDVVTYTIEPKEWDCRCPNILRYEDYFDPPRHG